MAFIAPIVEGHGEVDALPALLYRIRDAVAPAAPLRVNPPIRVKAGSFLHDADHFRKHVSLAAAKAAQAGGSVLILLDCDDGCPAEIGPGLLERAKAVRSDVPVFVALAYREYETWFLAAIRSLCGVVGLPQELEPPAWFETIRDAKGWIGERMPDGYDPVRHQLPLTRRMDLDQARAAASFDRLYRALGRLLAA
jgi:hypothetical protein